MVRVLTVSTHLACRRPRTGKGRPRNGRTSGGYGGQRGRPSATGASSTDRSRSLFFLFFFTSVPDEHVQQQMDL
jgi:hypothetical protein